MFETDRIQGDLRAESWLKLILSIEHPVARRLRKHVDGGRLTDDDPICPASFGFDVADKPDVQPLQTKSGLYCEVGFGTDGLYEIWFRLSTDANGNFCGFDVEYGPIAFEGVPDGITIGELIGVYLAASTSDGAAVE